MHTRNRWFEVDRKGLAQILARRGKQFAIFELVQNAWDEQSTYVNIILEPEGKGLYHLKVEDDNPGGFKNIEDAYTFFAPSSKKSDPEKRGRFNQGEKLVLAICKSAVLISETFGLAFNKDGYRTEVAMRAEKGTIFSGSIHMTRQEFAEVNEAVKLLLPPDNITTIYNGSKLLPPSYEILRGIDLPTVTVNKDGELVRTRRKTTIKVYRCTEGVAPMLYEMGIPIVELSGGEINHIDIGQKVPLNFERDNVTPAYLREVRAVVMNFMSEHLNAEESTAPWVNDALASPRIDPEAVRDVVRTRFGEKTVVRDMHDLEANDSAASKGYTVIHGATFPKEVWENIRAAEVVKPAGQIFPTPKPFSENGSPAEVLPESVWTPGMKFTAFLIKQISMNVLGFVVPMVVLKNFSGLAAFEHNTGTMLFNLKQFGWSGFNFTGQNRIRMLDTIIHELAHAKAGNHYSETYTDELARIGSMVTVLALEHPNWFAFNLALDVANV